MKVYAQELKDGLVEQLTGNGCVAYTSNILSIDNADFDLDFSKLIEKDNLALASSNPNQVDLFYLQSVLVSTGWNKNDDIFLPEELWASRKTPEDKQFNFMHNESDIIGHITSNRAADFNNNYLSDDLEVPPKDFNIITQAVIYTNWSDSDKRERIHKIIAEIKEGKWYVSMECFFPKFDYALKSSSGEINLIRREESSAFLTKYLRSYGGPGKYEDYMVGRVLRNLVFSGKGLVDQPANPRSIILREQSIANKQEITDMSDDKNKDFTVALQSELVDTKAELKNALASIEQLKGVASNVEELKNQVASLTQEKEKAETSLSEVQATLEAKNKELEEEVSKSKKLEETVASLENDVRTQARRNKLSEAGLSNEKLEDS